MHPKWKILLTFFLSIISGYQSFSQNSSTLSGNGHDKCMKFLNQFIESQKQFEQCAIKSGVPVTMCQNCVQPYVSTVQTFHDLTITPDPTATRQKCVDRFINHNTLNIVWNQYQNARNLWSEAACTSCFVDACDPDKLDEGTNVTQICTFNKNVIEFRNKTIELTKCFNTSDSKVGNNCVDCLQAFNSITNKYKQLGDSANGICFDVVDQFNQTKNIWYGEKHCPQPVAPSSVKWTYVLIIVLMSLLTLGGSIAGGYYLFAKYRQRGNYSEQIDSDRDGTATPPIYS